MFRNGPCKVSVLKPFSTFDLFWSALAVVCGMCHGVLRILLSMIDVIRSLFYAFVPFLFIQRAYNWLFCPLIFKIDSNRSITVSDHLTFLLYLGSQMQFLSCHTHANFPKASLRYSVGLISITHFTTDTEQIFNFSRLYVYYWQYLVQSWTIFTVFSLYTIMLIHFFLASLCWKSIYRIVWTLSIFKKVASSCGLTCDNISLFVNDTSRHDRPNFVQITDDYFVRSVTPFLSLSVWNDCHFCEILASYVYT